MSATFPSLNDLPTDILKEIVEVVARISVKNRGARNEICSLSLVNKRLYALAIKHIFRVINAQKTEHYSLEMPYTSMPPSALQHTRYLGLGLPSQRFFKPYVGVNPVIRASPSIATQFIAILSTAKNVKVVTIHAPKDVIDSFETQAEVLGVKFHSVVELHYCPVYPEFDYLSSTLPTLFPNLTTLVSPGFGGGELPFLIDVFNRHQLPHLKHLQLHQDFSLEFLERLWLIGSRLETLIIDTNWQELFWWYGPSARIHALCLVDCLEGFEGLKNISVPTCTLRTPAERQAFNYLLEKVYERRPNIEVIAQDYEGFYELRRRSSGFQEVTRVQKFETTASGIHSNERAKTWMRYLEPLDPHRRVKMANGAMSVVDINPILETPVLVDYPWWDYVFR